MNNEITKCSEHEQAVTPHGVKDVRWDSSGEGWQLSCLCGWNSGSSKSVERIGQEFDQHMREEAATK